MDAVDFGPSAENKMAAIEIFEMYVNAISLQWFQQSTSSLIDEVISPKGQTLLILGHLLQSRWPPLNFENKCL